MRRGWSLEAKKGLVWSQAFRCATSCQVSKGFDYQFSSAKMGRTYSQVSERVSVVAFFKVKAGVQQEGKESPIVAATKDMIAKTQKEPGCIRYDLHRDLSDPSRFVMIEEWESMNHLETHLKSSHVAAGRQLLKDILEVPTDIRKYVRASKEPK